MMDVNHTMDIMTEVLAERERQFARFGTQRIPVGLPVAGADERLSKTREIVEAAFFMGMGSFEHVLTEEYFEVMAAKTLAEQRHELIQLAAVCVQIVESIDGQST